MTRDADILSGIVFILFLVFIVVTWYIKHKGVRIRDKPVPCWFGLHTWIRKPLSWWSDPTNWYWSAARQCLSCGKTQVSDLWFPDLRDRVIAKKKDFEESE